MLRDSLQNTDRLVRGLGHLISRCSLWAISSGEQHDPLASALSIALRSTLGQQQADCQQQREEILQIVVNSIDVVSNSLMEKLIPNMYSTTLASTIPILPQPMALARTHRPR